MNGSEFYIEECVIGTNFITYRRDSPRYVLEGEFNNIDLSEYFFDEHWLLPVQKDIEDNDVDFY